MPRVLFVTYVFPPLAAGGAVRTGQIARFLPENGWDVTVLTATTSAAASIDQPALAALPDSVQVERAWAPNQLAPIRGRIPARSGWRRNARTALVRLAGLVSIPDRQVTWMPGALRRGRQLIRRSRPDVLFASYGPATSLLVAARLSREFEIPLVLDFRDLWSDLPLDVFATPWHRQRARWMERRTVATARRVTCVSRTMAEHLAASHGRRPEEVVAIPNGFDPDWVSRFGGDEAHREGGDTVFRLVFAGALHRFHDVDPFLTALAETLESGALTRDEIEVRFVGNLDSASVERFGLEGVVRCDPFVPHLEVADVLRGADALLLLEPPGYWGEFSYSAKTFDYAVTGKPVFTLAEPDANSARLLQELGVARLASPTEPKEIAAALVELVRGTPQGPDHIDPSSLPLARFDRRRLIERLSSVLEAAVTEGAIR